MRAIVLFFLVSGMLTACGESDSVDKKMPVSTAELQIISSIKPIQSIVLAIAGEHAHSEQLIPAYASPHSYSFKPSDIRKVKKADVIFRIDEKLEAQLNGVFESLESKTRLVTLSEAEGMKLLKSDDSHQDHENEKEEEFEHDESNHDDAHAHEGIDLHLWTSPRNARIIASVVTKTLSELDDTNAKYYQQNFEKFSELLKLESEKVSLSLAKYQSSQYIVFHSSWKYFADEFDLQKPIVIDLHEEVSSGAKTVIKIRNRIENENIQCVFYDSSVSQTRLKLLAGKVNTMEIDVLGKDLEINQTTYIKWLGQLSKQIESCLSTD